MESDVEALVEEAREGKGEALERLIAKIQDRVYRLAIRMLSHPADAEDATQEILIRIVTHLGQFRGESSFTSWVYRIACNYLLTTRKRRAERQQFSFAACERYVDAGLADSAGHKSPEAEQGLIVAELMLSCTQTLLLCLDRKLRIAYLLSEVMDMSSQEGASVLDISPAAFRKRVSRGRTMIRDFLQKNCGLVNPGNRCTCARMVPHTVRMGWIAPERLLFASHPSRTPQVSVPPEALESLDEEDRVKALFRSHPEYLAPGILLENLRRIIQSVRRSIKGRQAV